MRPSRFSIGLASALAVGAIARVAYVMAQPASDPGFDAPALDGALYWDWAGRLAAGQGSPPGAFYLAPLYPFLLALAMRLGAGFTAVYLAQHAIVLGTAAVLAVVTRRTGGDLAGWAAAAAILLYHPAMFLASHVAAEPLALLLLALALLFAGAKRPPGAALAGAAAGLAALARPNLVLVPILWAGARAARRDLRGALSLIAGGALIVIPVAVRNAVVSGHLVPISANAGITLYHGNGPGALGIFTPPEGFSGAVATQREEATRLASADAGRAMDDVEADRYWGRRALAARGADPLGSAALIAKRALLTIDDAEHGLDAAPALDENPWRRTSPLPFAILLGFATAGIALGGLVSTETMLALAACAATPVVFYVSSRYRLPFAVLLAVPAGAGLAGLAGEAGSATARRRRVACILGATFAASSWLLPSRGLARAEEAGGLVNRAVAYQHRGDLEAAERSARRAIESDPAAASASFTLGSILEARGRLDEAASSYREAIRRDPADPRAAGNLGGILIRTGRPAEAVPLLQQALVRNPGHAVAWNNLVVALLALGDRARAAQAAEAAKIQGIALDPELRTVLEAP